MSEVSTAADNRGTTSTGERGKPSRRRQLQALTAAILTVSLLLSTAFLLVGRLHSTPSDVLDHPVDPVTDEQSMAQVAGSVKEIVTVTGLRTTSAGYSLLSCKDQLDPPYQGAIYLNFALPPTPRPDAYFPAIAATLAAHGWIEGLPPNNHMFARTLSKDAVTVTLYRDSDDPSVGDMRAYGLCRDMSDHRRDTTAWLDVTDQFKTP